MPIIKKLGQHKILLDTHVWIWLMIGSPSLVPAFIKHINKIQDQENILVSPISIWEVGMLVEKNRIEIEMDCMDWVNQALSVPGIRIAPITPEIAIKSTRLSGEVHGDPADRLLIATAHVENAVLATCDQKILDYGTNKFVSVFDPTL